MDYQIDISDLTKKIEKLSDYGTVMRPALNETKKFMKSTVAKEVASKYRVSQKDVRQVSTARFSQMPLSIVVKVSSHRMTLIRFARGGKRNPSVEVRKGKKTSLKTPIFKNIIGGREQFARRLGRPRLPIEILRTLSISNMAKTPEVSVGVQKKTIDRLFNNVEKYAQKLV